MIGDVGSLVGLVNHAFARRTVGQLNGAAKRDDDLNADDPIPGLPDIPFSNQDPRFEKFFTALQWKRWAYFISIWSILWTFRKVYGHLVYLLLNWYIFPVLVSIGEKNLTTLSNSERHVEFKSLNSNRISDKF
jgi:hypothetical protein